MNSDPDDLIDWDTRVQRQPRRTIRFHGWFVPVMKVRTLKVIAELLLFLAMLGLIGLAVYPLFRGSP